MKHIQTAYEAILSGDEKVLIASIEAYLDENLSAETILQDGLISAMAEIGDRFENGEIYVPEMLLSARTMQSGLALLKPHLIESGVKATAKVVIGTVKGDLHDIGKNLVSMMLEGAGFEVIDLGNNVDPELFASTAAEHKAEIVAMSALLTTTMLNMGTAIEALKRIGLRDQVKVIVGGAPLTKDFCDELGADGFALDASAAVRLAKNIISE